MGLKIVGVVNGGDPTKEYVRLNTNEEVNLKGFAIVDRTFDTENELSNEFRHIFVFPKLLIAKDDWVRLYSSVGKYKKVKTEAGNYRHDFYWGSKICIWNNNGEDVASLIKYSFINSSPVPALE